VLSELYSRLGESGSPKRGREETLVLITLNLRLGEEIRVFERMGLAQARGARLSETTWCNHCFMLAQASWTSLSEADDLAWARVSGLS